MDLPTMAALTFTLRCKLSVTFTVMRFPKSAIRTARVNYVTCKQLHHKYTLGWDICQVPIRTCVCKAIRFSKYVSSEPPNYSRPCTEAQKK
jgi:hypothetical protein